MINTNLKKKRNPWFCCLDFDPSSVIESCRDDFFFLLANPEVNITLVPLSKSQWDSQLNVGSLTYSQESFIRHFTEVRCQTSGLLFFKTCCQHRPSGATKYFFSQMQQRFPQTCKHTLMCKIVGVNLLFYPGGRRMSPERFQCYSLKQHLTVNVNFTEGEALAVQYSVTPTQTNTHPHTQTHTHAMPSTFRAV